jgi:hypothetical protein
VGVEGGLIFFIFFYYSYYYYFPEKKNCSFGPLKKGNFGILCFASERGSKWLIGIPSFHTRGNLDELVIVHGCCFL